MNLVIRLIELGGIMLTVAAVAATAILFRARSAYRTGYRRGYLDGKVESEPVPPRLQADIHDLAAHKERRTLPPGA